MLGLGLVGLIVVIVLGVLIIGGALSLLKFILDGTLGILNTVNKGLEIFNRRMAAKAARTARPVTSSVPVTRAAISPWAAGAVGSVPTAGRVPATPVNPWAQGKQAGDDQT